MSTEAETNQWEVLEPKSWTTSGWRSTCSCKQQEEHMIRL